MDYCFADDLCGFLFMVGSVSLSSEPLQDLLKCIRDFDVEGDYFQAFQVADASVEAEGTEQCVASQCRQWYLQCQVSADCFLGKDTPIAQRLNDCIEERCVSTASPTASPTAQLSVSHDTEATGLIFEVNHTDYKVEFKHITAGNLNTVPIGAANALEGRVIVVTSCDLVSEVVAANLDLNGTFVIVKTNCNVYNVARIAASYGAIVVAFAVDSTAQQQWVPRDKLLALPVLSIEYGVAASLQAMLRREKQMQGHLSSQAHCDAMHASGVDTSLMNGAGDSCCAAGDIITSFLLQQHDFWNIGVREFPFCIEVENANTELVMGCVQPSELEFEKDTVCSNLCKRNGICEDGGIGSVGHSCAWGGDCQDCGPRNLAHGAAPGIAYGRPTQPQYDKASEFLCGNEEGRLCQEALAAKYAEFHGELNIYTSITRSLCYDTSCIGYDVPSGSDTMCCFAAQIAAAYVLETLYNVSNVSPFSGVCADDLNATSYFDFSCDENLDGTMRPLLTSSSFDIVCRLHAPCLKIAEAMLLDVRQKQRSIVGDSSSVVSHIPLDQVCGAPAGELEVCGLLPFAEYLTNSTLSRGGMSCCVASATAIVDLLRQTDLAAFEERVCPAGCEAIVNDLDTTLAAAKNTLRSPSCFENFAVVVESIGRSDYGRGGMHHMDRPSLREYVESGDVCWLRWLLPTKPVNKTAQCCEAADIILEHHLWRHQPAIALDVYNRVSHNASEDTRSTRSLSIAFDGAPGEEAVAAALSTIHDNGWGEDLDAFMSTEIEAIVDPNLFQVLTADPCRCKAPGCGLVHHDEGQRGRPICYVASTECVGSVSSVHEEEESWAFCSVNHGTCQTFTGNGPCAPFIQDDGGSIFVPKGETLESLQFIAADKELGSTESNQLEAWLLEAALVSPTCYATHGSHICSSRLRRCEAGDDGIPRPVPGCHSDCTSVFSRKAAHGAVFNDPLRAFDGDTVCNWKLVPAGFQTAANLAASDMKLGDASRLQTVLGVDSMLKSISNSKASFGQALYPKDLERCVSVDPAINLTKALAQVVCPDRFVKNPAATLAEDASDFFCVGTCPSNSYSSSQYWVLWLVFTLPGMFAFVINVSALVSVALGLGSQKTKVGDLLLTRLAAMAGLFGVVPVALSQQHLLCTCDSELCMRNDLLCKLNQTSIYMLMATTFMLLWNFAMLLAKLGSPRMRRFHFNDRTKQCVWIVPLLLAAMSFALEEDGNERFHLARAGVRCQFSYSTASEELFLLHLPMGFCVSLMAVFVGENLRLCSKVVANQYTERSVANILKVLAAKPPMRKLLVNGCLSIVLMILWLSQAVTSWLVFENYLESVNAWLVCIRFDFARRMIVGDEWDELASADSDGELCSTYPMGTGLFESQVLKILFEALLPCVVAMSFSRKLLRGIYWRMLLPKRYQTTVVPNNAALPYHGPSSSECLCCNMLYHLRYSSHIIVTV
jgi:hypothetical protein